jgi:hypothetical protein
MYTNLEVQGEMTELHGIYKDGNKYRIRVGYRNGRYDFERYLKPGASVDTAIFMRNAAVKFLNRKGRDLIIGKYNRSFLTKPTARNTSGRVGVSLYSSNGVKCWAADFMYRRKTKKKLFSVKKFGYEGAFRRACEQRQAWELK